jgi:two-component system, NtrC family, response regulator AtoC
MISFGRLRTGGFSENEVIVLRELGRFVGESDPVRWMKGFIEKIAPLENSVLISGPSGAGKNLLAEIVHALSRRREKPLIRFSCALAPEEDSACMLFGTDRDSAKGITHDIPGKLQSAHGGTLLLDEIGDLSLSMQGRLLGFLENDGIEKSGSAEPVPIDVRLLATTRQNLSDLIHQGRFREDLFYRLNVVSLQVPPLKDRLADLPALVRHLLAAVNVRLSTRFADATQEALDVLAIHDWPGNVRELENVLERAAILTDGDTLQEPEVRTALREAFGGTRPSLVNTEREKLTKGQRIYLKEVVQKVEKQMILNALTATNGVQAEAAQILGLNPKNLWKKIQKHAIRLDRLKGTGSVAG